MDRHPRQLHGVCGLQVSCNAFACLASTGPILPDVVHVVAAKLVEIFRHTGDQEAHRTICSLLCTCRQLRNSYNLCSQLRALVWDCSRLAARSWPLGTRPRLSRVSILYITGDRKGSGAMTLHRSLEQLCKPAGAAARLLFTVRRLTISQLVIQPQLTTLPKLLLLDLCRGLRQLCLEFVVCGASFLRCIAQCRNLQHIKLCSTYFILGNGLAPAVQHISAILSTLQLHQLQLQHGESAAQQPWDLRSIRMWSMLRSLTMRGVSVNTFQAFHYLSRLRALQQLCICLGQDSAIYALHDAACLNVSPLSCLVHLKALELCSDGCPELIVSGMHAVAHHANIIERLVLEGVRLSSVNCAQFHWPQLQYVRCTGYLHCSLLVQMWPACLETHFPQVLTAKEGPALVMGWDAQVPDAVWLLQQVGVSAMRLLVRSWHVLQALHPLRASIKHLELDVWYEGRTPPQVCHLLHSLPHLQRLQLAGVYPIVSEDEARAWVQAIPALLRGLHVLQWLQLASGGTCNLSHMMEQLCEPGWEVQSSCITCKLTLVRRK